MNYEYTKTKIITIKSPKLKFSDIGYVRNSNKDIGLELFIAGTCVERFTIENLICTSSGCMSKSGFNEDYLNSAYPDDTLENILLGEAIYDEKNMQETAYGFEQYIQDEYVDIEYVVTQNVVYFKDKKNNIIFQIKDTDVK